MRGIICCILLLVMSSSSPGAIVLTFESGRVFEQNSGVQTVDILANWNGVGGQTRGTLGFDVLLQTGVSFAPNPNGYNGGGVTAPGATSIRTGFIGEPGFIGAGNLPVTFFDENDNLQTAATFFLYEPAQPNFAVLGFDFDASQSFPINPQTLARMTINVNGLAPGSYSMQFANSGTNVISGGSFTIITAVPEPSSIVGVSLLGIVGCVYGWRRRSKRLNQRHGA